MAGVGEYGGHVLEVHFVVVDDQEPVGAALRYSLGGLGPGLWVSRGHEDGEDRTSADVALQPDLAPERADDVAGEGETDARAPALGIGRGELHEGREYPSLVLGQDPRAGVGDRHDQIRNVALPLFDRRVDPHFAPLGERNRVVQHRDEGAPEPVRIGAEGLVGDGAELETYALGDGGLARGVADPRHEARQGESVLSQRGGAGLESDEIEDVAQHFEEALGARDDRRCPALRLGAAHLDEPRRGEDARDGAFELVAHGGEEVTLGSVRPLRLLLGEAHDLFHGLPLAYVLADQDRVGNGAGRRSNWRGMEGCPGTVVSGAQSRAELARAELTSRASPHRARAADLAAWPAGPRLWRRSPRGRWSASPPPCRARSRRKRTARRR